MVLGKQIFFAAFGFLLCFILMRQCEGGNKTSTIVDKIIYKDKVVKVPEVVEKVVTNTVYLLQRDTVERETTPEVQYLIDSVSKEKLALITKDYYNIYYYRDSVFLDSIGLLVIGDSVQANKIMSRSIDWTITTPVVQKKKRAYLSASILAGGNTSSIDLGVGLMLTTKKRLSIGYVYNFVDKAHYVSLSKNIFNRK